MSDQKNTSKLMANNLPGLKKRHLKEFIFKSLGFGAIAMGLLFLVLILGTIGYNGVGAFQKTFISLPISSDVQNTITTVGADNADYYDLNREVLRAQTPEASGRREIRALYGLVSVIADSEMKNQTLNNLDNLANLSIRFTASDDVDLYVRGVVKKTEDGAAGRLNTQQVGWIDELREKGMVNVGFNWGFFMDSDSRDPELAGVKGAFIGSLFTLLVCLVLSFIVGVLSAIYLEEFAKKGFFTNLVEVNIANLAAVPSIIYGLLGLAIFLNFFGLPRSASLVGGLTLSLMTLPTIIIASRVALQSVPLSIREAAFGLGASKVQMVFHHVFPLALPGMLTGTIIGMARALGETAPLLMIGMVAFIADAPSNILDPATTLPVQVFLWADSPERGFMEKTSGAIIVLIVTLIAFNLLAVILRKKFEKKW